MLRRFPSARAASGSGRGAPYALGRVSRILLVSLLVAAIAVIGHLYLDGMLSRTRLDDALVELNAQMEPAVRSIFRSRRTLGAVAFLAGIAMGWLSAWQWMTVRHRQRSLVLADLRQGDMPFGEGVGHIRRNARPRVDNDRAAMGLILAEAGRGRISLWHRAASDTLSRVPSRHVRLATARIINHSARSRTTDPWRDFLLLREEIESRWPSLPAVPMVPHAVAGRTG